MKKKTQWSLVGLLALINVAGFAFCDKESLLFGLLMKFDAIFLVCVVVYWLYCILSTTRRMVKAKQYKNATTYVAFLVCAIALIQYLTHFTDLVALAFRELF